MHGNAGRFGRRIIPLLRCHQRQPKASISAKVLSDPVFGRQLHWLLQLL